MTYDGFNRALQENYIKPMNAFFRDHYRDVFKEEPPEDINLVLERLQQRGEDQLRQIRSIIEGRDKP